MPAEPLAELARAVLDGTPVDWVAAESAADPAARPVIRQLRLLEGMAAVHRREPANAPTQSWTPEVFSSAAVAPAPEQWAHLKILERIGHGAFGAVYRAWDSRLDREVALKLLPARTPRDESGASSIIEEGRLLARVRHPNVVTIHGAEQIGGQIGLWMELVRGQTLEQLLQRGTVFSAADVIGIGTELAGAVAAVHAAGLLHRDIKAHNVTRATDGRVVLMDFGAGRELEDGSAPDLTGTPLYLAPEVLGGAPASAQSDIYGLGVLLYHLLTGAYPVHGRSLADLRRAHERDARADLADVRRGLPPALTRVIARAIDPDPSRRHRTAAALASDLASLQRRPRTIPIRYVAAAAAVVILAAGAWWTTRAGSAPPWPRLAVLTFASPGAPPDDEALTVGLPSEIQRRLASSDGLSVLSFTRSSRIPSTDGDRQRAGRDLHADFVLDGSIVRSDRGLIVTPRLMQVSDGSVLWAMPLERSTDIPTIQDDIARAVANRLNVHLGEARRQKIALDAYYDFLRGRALQARRTPESSRQAATLFERVVDREPGHAPSWAGIAASLAEANRLQSAGFETLDPRIGDAADHAVVIDPDLAEAQVARGSVLAARLDWPNAETAFRRAIDRDPTLTLAYTEFVLASLLPQERLEEALTYLEAAEARDPLSLDIRRVKALVQVESGQYDAAIVSCKWVLGYDPTFPYINLWYGRALAMMGYYQQAIDVFEHDDFGRAYVGYALARMGRRADAERMLAEFATQPHRQMLIYAGLDDKAGAFAALDRLMQVNRWFAATWIIRPELKFLRGDPRYAAIKAQLGLSK